MRSYNGNLIMEDSVLEKLFRFFVWLNWRSKAAAGYQLVVISFISTLNSHILLYSLQWICIFLLFFIVKTKNIATSHDIGPCF